MEKLYLKFFIYLLSRRRNFIPILSIYFLTLPNTLANQIGMFNGLGFLASFLLEIPSGYFADNFGHRKTLILGKIFQVISVVLFILGSYISPNYTILVFSLGAIFQAIGFSLFSGTTAAYFHELLKENGKENDYSKLMGKLRGQVSLLSVPIIITLPFFTKIDITLPFFIGLFIDLIGLVAIILMPKSKNNIKIKEKLSLIGLLKSLKNTRILGYSISLGMIGGFFVGASTFRGVYLESLGYPIIFIGLIMGVSRLIRYGVGNYSYIIEEKLTIKQFFLLETFIYPISFLAVAYFSNPYLVGFLFSLFVGFLFGRKSVMDSYILKDINHDYKSTILSIESQINSIATVFVSFGISYIMGHSYKLGLATLGVILFFILSINYYFTFRKKNLIPFILYPFV